MTHEELLALEHKNTAALIAPAGHGKTELVVDMVETFTGKQLVLTHTNAGVDAIEKRLAKRKISPNKFTVLTIAAFCMKWGYAYHHTAKINPNLSPIKKSDRSKYYAQIYPGAVNLFQHAWAGSILKSAYSGIIVDEYQDCTLVQHELITKLSAYLPVKVLGDPLQGIFGFKDPIVDWNNLGFEIIQTSFYPWRWENSNKTLGKYLSALRTKLLPTLDGKICTLNLRSVNNVVQIISPNGPNGQISLPPLHGYESVLYLTKWETDQLAFCKQMRGIFQQDEKQDFELLFSFAETFDKSIGGDLLLWVLKFVSHCATQVRTECASFIKRLESNSTDFSRIKKNSDLGVLLLSLHKQKSCENIRRILKWFYDNSTFKFYRKELYFEMMRSLKYAQAHNGAIYDAAMHIRNDPMLQKRYAEFKFLSSRALLSKGLEFDCVIIDTSKQLTAKEFYVAMTRAKRMIYIISDKQTLSLIP